MEMENAKPENHKELQTCCIEYRHFWKRFHFNTMHGGTGATIQQ